MFFERFTEKARTAVVLAQQQARERGDDAIDTGHLLRALFAVPDNLAVMVLEGFSVRRADVEADLDRCRPGDATGGTSDASSLAALGIDLDEVRRRVEEAFGPGALDHEVPPTRHGLFGRKVSHGPFTPRSKKVLELSLREALRLKHRVIASEHILLGLLREGEGLAAQILAEGGVDFADIRRQVEQSLRTAA